MSEKIILCLLVVLFASFGVRADVIHYKGSVSIRVRTTSNVIATFIAAAYLEHRFGREVYLREIETYSANYEKVRTAGKDKPLVFPDWLNPTREDRILVYDKGAYVLHLLREEMGEANFWKGLRSFTRRHFGKSVVTNDFLVAMEEAHGKA